MLNNTSTLLIDIDNATCFDKDTIAEIEALFTYAKENDYALLCQIIQALLIWHESSSVEQAAKAVGLKKDKVQRWIDSFMQRGCCWLYGYRVSNYSKPPSKNQRERALIPLFPLLGDTSMKAPSELALMIGILHEVVCMSPELLELMEKDLDAYGKRRRKNKDPEEGLGTGRPRIPVFVLLVCLCIRVYWFTHNDSLGTSV